MTDELVKMHSTMEQWLATGGLARVTVLREQSKALACRILEAAGRTYCIATQEELNAGETIWLSSSTLPGDQPLIAKVLQCMASTNCYFVAIEAIEDRLARLDAVALRALFDAVPANVATPPRKMTAASFGLAAASLLVTTGLLLSVSGLIDRASAGERVLLPPSTQDAATDVPDPPPLESQGQQTGNLFIRAAGLSWVTGCADGKRLFDRLFQPGDTATIPFSETAIVRSGNAGGLEVTFAGQTLGLMGQWGDIRMLRATTKGYDYVPPVLSESCLP